MMNAARGRPLREVLIRFVRTEAYQDAVVAARAAAVLAANEREALARLRPAAARRDYLAAHALARTMLSERAGCDPALLRFCSSPGGRPELVAPAAAHRLSFSISHADGVALCAVAAGCAVGADVESLRNVGPDPLGVAEAVCSRRESDALRALSPLERADRLLSLWTLKEAVAKATGLGFRFPLTRITISWLDGGPHVVEFDPEAAHDPSPWRLASLRLTPSHMAAVAVFGAPAADVTVRFEEDDCSGIRHIGAFGAGCTSKCARASPFDIPQAGYQSQAFRRMLLCRGASGPPGSGPRTRAVTTIKLR